MRRVSAALLRNARRALADTSTHHQQHHSHTHHYTHIQHDGSCTSSAFTQVMPGFEHIHEHTHSHHHEQTHIPHASEQPALGPHGRHLPLSILHYPILSALGFIRHAVLQTRHCSTSAWVAPSCETPIQRTSVGNTNFTQHLSHDAAQGDLSSQETRKLITLIKVEDFKKRLFNTGKHCMSLDEVLELCKQTGTVTSNAEAEEIVKTLDEAGDILIFRKKVFLEPGKVAEALSRAMPLPLAFDDDPRNQEYARLQKEKDEIDQIAHRQVRNMLWGAFGALSAQSMLFFRLTFWELSWDVMEPIAFFVTSSSLLAGFFFFVITKRDPSYHDFMDTLFSSKQRKLIKKRNFNLKRFQELQVLCCLPSSQNSSKLPHISHAH